jgi:hypothetical protein
MREPSNYLPTAFQLPSNCLCVGPPITPRVLEHPTPGWNRAGVPTPRAASGQRSAKVALIPRLPFLRGSLDGRRLRADSRRFSR